MMGLSDISSLLAKIDARAVADYLVRRGFRRTGGESGQVDVYMNSANEVVLVPLNCSSPSYPCKLRDLLELFVDNQTSIDDVVGNVVLPNSDILRYRIASPETTWGHLRLHYTHEAMHALFDLLQYTAAGVSTQRRDYRRISESAQSFANQCRFGQTEYGSFILKVFCPVNPIGVAHEVAAEPFGRTAVRAVVENLEFLASPKAEDPSEPLPPTLNRNVASAVERLRPYRE